jgi:hypothetical protein
MTMVTGRLVTQWGLRLLVAVGLAVDAYVHVDLAPAYDAIGDSLTQGTLFRVAAGAAAVSALLVLVVDRIAAYLFAFGVAASALGAVLLYRWVDVGALGPLPNMYEPVWYADKTISAIGEAVATVAAALLIGLSVHMRQRRSSSRLSRKDIPFPI